MTIDFNNKEYELKAYRNGYNLIGGIDEVGRGPLVGPVVASCVILPKDFEIELLTETKKLSESKREQFYSVIMEKAISVGIGVIDEDKIDEVNIYEATKLAMYQAIENC